MIDNSMPFFNIIILISVIGIIIFIIYIEPRISKHKIKNKNEHGSSKFADMKEITKTFKQEQLSSLEDAGFPIWFEKKNNHFNTVYFDNTSPHWVLIGSSGSGKSTCIVLPECIMFAKAKNKRSIIVTDPKGEIFSKTSKLFKDNGYNIYTIDFRNPNLSNRINIMQPIINEWKLHCSSNNKLFICMCYLYEKLKIDYDLFVSNESYRNEIKLKNKIDNYIIEYLLNKIDTINDNLQDESSIINDKSIFKDDFKEINDKSLVSFFNKMKLSILLDYIKTYQNDSSSHQAESIRLTNSLADLIFVEKDDKDPFWLNSAKNLFKGICGIFLEDYQNGLIPEEKINISSIKKFQNSSLIKENQMYLQRNLNNREYGTLSKDYLTSILSASENTYKSITTVFASKMQIFDDLNVENITSISEFEFSSIVNNPTILYIIVPDEDKSYYQLITIIVGIIYKDLTKLANLPENKGTLPRKIEWILDEFANCPPLAEIDTIVSVARSRGMRFQFFIQSFAQLENVYTKEVASIILDNSALCYLKTNSVDCANIISQKLGKATIETSSISQSTDTFKVGANQTTSLVGRELLTPNEIIALKYKIIIFPTISNPIFRDTYLYNKIFDNVKEFDPIERTSKMLKKNTSTYYTVEQMKMNYENNLQNNISSVYEEFDKEEEQKVMYKNNNLNIEKFIDNIKEVVEVQTTSFFNDIYTLTIDKKISKYEENKIIDLTTPYITCEILIDENGITTINIWREVDLDRQRKV